MPTGADLGPDLEPAICHVCHQPAGLSYWIDERRWPVHTHCRDWASRSFIFERQLRSLRRRREREPPLGELVQWLEDARRHWPRDAVRVVEEGTRRLRRVGLW